MEITNCAVTQKDISFHVANEYDSFLGRSSGATLRRIKNIIYGFASYDLDSLNDNGKLMNRVDTKYLLPLNDLPELLDYLGGYYEVLKIDNKCIFTYENSYLDTDDFEFFRKHHNGKQNRYKVRYRHYVDSSTKFLEVKFKNNKSRTIKNRIRVDNGYSSLDSQINFLTEQLETGSENLQICQNSSYKRISLLNNDGMERLTIDFDLEFSSPFEDGKNVRLGNLCIAELKQPYQGYRSPFGRMMRQLSVQPTSFSKYCIGCCSLYPEYLKRNRFKPVLRIIKNLVEE